MLSLFLSPFVVINITASYVSLNVVESETFQNKRNEEGGWCGNFNVKESFDVEEKRTLERRRAGLYPILKLGYIFILLKQLKIDFYIFFYVFQIQRVYHEYFMCVGIFSNCQFKHACSWEHFSVKKEDSACLPYKSHLDGFLEVFQVSFLFQWKENTFV